MYIFQNPPSPLPSKFPCNKRAGAARTPLSKEMYGTTGNATAEATEKLERTAFRKAEKQYKLYKAPNSNGRSKKHQQRDQYRHTELSDVVDFDRVLRLHRQGEELPPGIFALDCPGFSFTVFCFRDRPGNAGFYFIPGALSVEDQCHWVRESLASFPQPPNRTNHTAFYGPIHDLFLAAQKQMVMVEASSEPSSSESGLSTSKYMFCESSAVEQDKHHCSRPIPAAVLLRKLRWSTLGLQFDWSKRNYDISLPHKKIPDELSLLAKKMAAPAMPPGEEFHPEAAIINYFGPSDTLGGHLDDMEADWSKPIVSISLGCEAIFLLGGKSREDVPVAMFLRSGDIVLMAGQARECFHGVPRILTDGKSADASLLISKFLDEGDQALATYMKNSRININIRQVN